MASAEPAAPMPRYAVDRILQSSIRLLDFWQFHLGLVDLTALAARTANAQTTHALVYDDLGAWKEVGVQANKMGAPVVGHGLAQHEYFNALTTVRLWTALDAGVNDLILALLARGGRWQTLKVVRDSKLPLGRFLTLSPFEQLEELQEVVFKDTGAKSKSGLGRYEAALQAVGLGGEPPKELWKQILELVETRHVLVHREGNVDAKFTSRCPWVPVWHPGVVKVLRPDFHRLATAVLGYAGDLMVRLQEHGFWDGEPDDFATGRATAMSQLAKLELVERPKPTGDKDRDFVLLMELSKNWTLRMKSGSS